MLHIGFDDTDSRNGMCTTYLAFKIVRFLLENKVRFMDYPLLIRLNPNIPWKTRGNGALCLRIEADDEDRIMRGVKEIFHRNICREKGTNPALALYSSDSIPEELNLFASDALHKLIRKREALRLANKHNIKTYTIGNGQGLIGSLAAIGTLLDQDHTFELISYRLPDNCGRPRIISEESVMTMDRSTYPYTFNNYDYREHRILITPHGPDPVFCGIRGEDPFTLVRAFDMINFSEKILGYMIFRTNHGTNAHLQRELDLANLKVYSSGYVNGIVDSKPYTIKGGHTFFSLRSYNGSALCAIYEPTGLSPISQRLNVGDEVEVAGGIRRASVKHPRVINVEYIRIIKLKSIVQYRNPQCVCGRRLKSAGKNKGYKCEHCSYRCFSEKISLTIERDLKAGLYIAVPKAHRHLTKPLQRFGREKDSLKYDLHDWFNIYENLISEQ